MYLIWGCLFTLTTATQWWVSHLGADNPDCGDILTPCQTLNYTYLKSDSWDTISLAAFSNPYAPLTIPITHSLTIQGSPEEGKISCPVTEGTCTFEAHEVFYLCLSNLQFLNCQTPGTKTICLTNVTHVDLRMISFLYNIHSGGFWFYENTQNIPHSIDWYRVIISHNTLGDDASSMVSFGNYGTSITNLAFRSVTFRNNTGAFLIQSASDSIRVLFDQVSFSEVELWLVALNYQSKCLVSLQDSTFSNFTEGTIQCGQMTGTSLPYQAHISIDSCMFSRIHHQTYGYSLVAFMGPDNPSAVNILRVHATNFEDSEDTGLRVFSLPSVQVIITGTNFTNNWGTLGGGLYVGTGGVNSSLVLDRCIFRNNVATQGGGLATYQVSKVFVTTSHFTNNWATNGIHDLAMGVDP